jgi:hypothetical protein
MVGFFTVLEPVVSPTVGVGHKGSHVTVNGDTGPMLVEDPLAERVLLAEPHSSHAGPLEPEIEPADAAEK